MGPGFESLKVHGVCGTAWSEEQKKVLTKARKCGILKIVGEIYAEGPPVPIPNTEVKLCRAEDTWLETARENRYSPTPRQRLEFF